MLSKTATDVLSECEYERIRRQLHHALRGDGNPPQGVRVGLAGRCVSMLRGTSRDQGDARRNHHASN